MWFNIKESEPTLAEFGSLSSGFPVILANKGALRTLGEKEKGGNMSKVRQNLGI